MDVFVEEFDEFEDPDDFEELDELDEFDEFDDEEFEDPDDLDEFDTSSGSLRLYFSYTACVSTSVPTLIIWVTGV